MIKIIIIFNSIFMFLSFVLFNYAMFLSIFYRNLTDFKFTILIFHSSFNFTILILYIPIIVKNKRIKDYINQVENEMNLINDNLQFNDPINIDYIDLKNNRGIFKPIIYNNYNINLFYESEKKKIDEENRIEDRRESEVKINDENLN